MHTITIGHCPCGRRATLVNGLCGFCDDADSTIVEFCPLPESQLRPLTVSRALEMLVAELAAEEIAAPLSMRFTLAAVAADLCRLAGEPVPAAVLGVLDEPTHALVYRERYQEPA